jgi:hypothetical protein
MYREEGKKAYPQEGNSQGATNPSITVPPPQATSTGSFLMLVPPLLAMDVLLW